MNREYEDLKKLYQSSLDPNRTAAKGCPDEDMIIESFLSKLSESEKYRVVDHISECSVCSQKFAIVREIFNEGKKMAAEFEGMSLSEEETKKLKDIARANIKKLERPDRSDRGTTSKQTSLFLLWQKTAFKYATALAGLVVIAVVVILLFRVPHMDLDDTVRGIQADIIQLTNPKGDLTEIPRMFEWSSVEGAAEYRVVLLNEELIEVWVSEKIQKTSLKLPELHFDKMKSGKMYYWKVIVFLNDGGTTESRLQEFEIKTD